MHEEIKDRSTSANKCYYNLLNLFKSKCQAHELKKNKIPLYKLLTADPNI